MLVALEQLPPPRRAPGQPAPRARYPRLPRSVPAISRRRIVAALLVLLAVGGGLLAVLLDLDPFGL
jgi:hypothetical protein